MSNAVEEIQVDIEDAKLAVEKADQLDRLHQNADFKALIVDGYFKSQAADLVQQKAYPSFQTPEIQAAISRSIDAIGELQQYFSGIFQQGMLQEEAIRQAQNELADMAEAGEL
jgi:hypothetical protein